MNGLVLVQIKHSGPEVTDPSYLTLTNVTMEDATRYSCIVVDQNSEQSYIYHWLIVKPRRSSHNYSSMLRTCSHESLGHSRVSLF
jgi:hypothetical protein